MTIAWVLPSIDAAFRRACVATMHPNIRRRTHIVDNTAINIGCAASWNKGAEYAAGIGADWLIIVSESIRFGVAGGTDFEAGLAGDWVFAECDHTCTPVIDTGAGFCTNGYGWHLAAFSTKLIATVGRFEERFVKPGYEDADYTYRMAKAGYTGYQHTHLTGIDAHLAACEHSTAAGFVTTPSWANASLYHRIHGGPPGHERW